MTTLFKNEAESMIIAGKKKTTYKTSGHYTKLELPWRPQISLAAEIEPPRKM